MAGVDRNWRRITRICDATCPSMLILVESLCIISEAMLPVLHYIRPNLMEMIVLALVVLYFEPFIT